MGLVFGGLSFPAQAQDPTPPPALSSPPPLTVVHKGVPWDHPPQAVILMYHRFGEEGLPTTNIQPDQVRTHLHEIAQAGMTVVSLPQVVQSLRGFGPLPKGAVAITVDDGYASVFEVGWPIFKQAHVPWTLFINTDSIGHSGYMTWAQVRTLAAAGVTIGAHSNHHAHLTRLDADALEQDMVTMLGTFQQQLHQRPTLYAYPYGEASASVIKTVRAFGFRAAFGQQSGAVGYQDGDSLWLLPRYALNEHYGTAQRVRQILHTVPLAVDTLHPQTSVADITIANPPPIGFTVRDPQVPVTRLTCYGPQGQPVPVEVKADPNGGTAVEVQLQQPLAKGRSRVNCTAPAGTAADGVAQWYWRGMELLVPGAWD